MQRIQDILEKISQQLSSVSETPRLDAEVLLSAAIKAEREELWAHPEKQLTPSQQEHLMTWVQRRLNQEPVAYILGYKEFWSLKLVINRDVLIPRPETEMLVEWGLRHLDKNAHLHVADLGTGSGAVALALALERPGFVVHATDRSEKALRVARMNAEIYELSNVHFYRGEWCKALPKNNYAAIFGNPPYIAKGDDHLNALKYEPREALISGPEGLDAIRAIIVEAPNYLAQGGYLILEHGFDQSEKITQLLQKSGYREVRDYSDLSGLPRMIVGRKWS